MNGVPRLAGLGTRALSTTRAVTSRPQANSLPKGQARLAVLQKCGEST